ncbi:MAG: OmpH family outer membrane protein [Spirochaetes bacterium]|nr:OmpH family outer membrane protein [Spirochaetota bacterium]
MKKRFIILLIFIAILPLNIFSNVLIKVGVVDLKEVYNFYMKRTLVDIGIDYYSDQIKLLDEDYNNKMKEFEQRLSNPNLTQDQKNAIISDRNSYIDRYQKRRQYFVDLINDLKTNKEKYINEHIYFCIKRVAEREGYSIILDKNDSKVLYFANYVDLTNAVIEFLKSYIEKNCRDSKIDVNVYYYPYINN